MMEPNDDEASGFAFWEVTKGDPGHLGDDEPEVRPLCRECVRELPADDAGLCDFCTVVTP